MTAHPIHCEYNLDTIYVEAVYSDGSMLAIDCDAIEMEYARNIYEQSELDYLILTLQQNTAT